MSKKQKKVCATLNYIVHLLVLPSAIAGCVSISALASLVGIPIDPAISAVELKICAIVARIKKYMSIFIKRRKKSDEIVLLAKTKLNSIEVLISTPLVDSYISHDDFQ